VNETAEGIERIGVYRAAMRQILRHQGLDTEERIRGMVNLVQHAKRERYADLIIRALLSELEWSIDRDNVEAQKTFRDEQERHHRRLRGERYERCPECCSPLSTEVDWMVWRQLRASAIAEAEAKERAGAA
jgi:hypothetical protein